MPFIQGRTRLEPVDEGVSGHYLGEVFHSPAPVFCYFPPILWIT